jgi:glucose-6-phosphate isomerase
MTPLVSSLPEWKNLESLSKSVGSIHVRDLLADEARNNSLITSLDNSIHLDLSHSKITGEVLDKFGSLFDKIGLDKKIAAMFNGEHINVTEDRAVLHTALRRPTGGSEIDKEVHAVLDSIKKFAAEIRSGALLGVTGLPLTQVVCVGIGGSYLGPEFVLEALRSDPSMAGAISGRTLRFLANVDPVDVYRALGGLDPARTLVIVISKTFTTAETMMNAKTVRKWLLDGLVGKDEKKIISHHFCAVSTAIEKTTAFGISRVFGFWDWVGGRFSVCSAVGILPLALHFGFEVCEKFLAGAHYIDEHFRTTEWRNNIPILMGMVSVWNSSFLRIPANAILPYTQALVRFVAHIQQVDMESNGKRVDIHGNAVDFSTGQIIFGEPGTNGQHSFYQLLHQGTTIASADFIGFKHSLAPQPIQVGETLENHDELMSNFFAQPDALAFGKTDHNACRHFPGDRPSLSLLLPKCDAFHVGALLAIYEHRTAVQAFIWNTNAFDQWGVELGKVLAKNLRPVLADKKTNENKNLLLAKYLQN